MIKDSTVYCDQCRGSIPKNKARICLGAVICPECHDILKRAIDPDQRSSGWWLTLIRTLLVIPMGLSALFLLLMLAAREMPPTAAATGAVFLVSLGFWLLATILYETRRISGQHL